MSEDYNRLEKVALSVNAGIVLVGNDVTSLYPFKKSIILSKIEEIRDEEEYTIRDVDDKRNKLASKELSAALIVAYVNDLQYFYSLMKKDTNTLTKLTVSLFVMVLVLTGLIVM